MWRWRRVQGLPRTGSLSYSFSKESFTARSSIGVSVSQLQLRRIPKRLPLRCSRPRAFPLVLEAAPVPARRPVRAADGLAITGAKADERDVCLGMITHADSASRRDANSDKRQTRLSPSTHRARAARSVAEITVARS